MESRELREEKNVELSDDEDDSSDEDYTDASDEDEDAVPDLQTDAMILIDKIFTETGSDLSKAEEQRLKIALARLEKEDQEAGELDQLENFSSSQSELANQPEEKQDDLDPKLAKDIRMRSIIGSTNEAVVNSGFYVALGKYPDLPNDLDTSLDLNLDSTKQISKNKQHKQHAQRTSENLPRQLTKVTKQKGSTRKRAQPEQTDHDSEGLLQEPGISEDSNTHKSSMIQTKEKEQLYRMLMKRSRLQRKHRSRSKKTKRSK